jgi:hypothetical protein
MNRVSKADATTALNDIIRGFNAANPYRTDSYEPLQSNVQKYLQAYFGMESLLEELFSDADVLQFRRFVYGTGVSPTVLDAVPSPKTNAELSSLMGKAIMQAKVYLDKIQRWPSAGVDISSRYGIEPRETASAQTPSGPTTPTGMIVRPIPLFPHGVVEPDSTLCFVIMPFASSFSSVYSTGIKPAVEACGLVCKRGDDIQQPGTIVRQIWDSLLRSHIVIADLTGSNGNVLYELGLAHVIGHEAILLTQRIDDVPYDLRQQRHIVYSQYSPPKLRTDLEAAVRAAIEAKAHS